MVWLAPYKVKRLVGLDIPTPIFPLEFIRKGADEEDAVPYQKEPDASYVMPISFTKSFLLHLIPSPSVNLILPELASCEPVPKSKLPLSSTVSFSASAESEIVNALPVPVPSAFIESFAEGEVVATPMFPAIKVPVKSPNVPLPKYNFDTPPLERFTSGLPARVAFAFQPKL